ncbi:MULTISPECIES: SixA phosphatase family protein [Oceanibaculum]|uniref:Phosphohistidine phosphatase n=1 Tax=Oceanibaculum indicum TaxID=526216 RepID=A0A420WQ21_9PROT|nr:MULTISPECIES: histidine phosphatase family protein [Oceanibaculum]MCH2395689.1 histidine phosphatase family protein [Oceanibaculum sp.]RKQ73138.1 phosphohistidine phosphatase [Oceanibaculum indicum]
MKTLYLLRHAKSSWDDPGLKDEERPLNERGFRAATVMGLYFAQCGYRPDAILCSTARRALETLDQVRPRLAGKPALTIDKAIYRADSKSLLEMVRALPEDTGSVLVVGHNPALEEFALSLAGSGAKDARERMEQKYPTCALAVFSLPKQPWAEIDWKNAELRSFTSPKDLV